MKKTLMSVVVVLLLVGCTCERPFDNRTVLNLPNPSYSELEVNAAINVVVDNTATDIQVTIGESISDHFEARCENHKLRLSLKPGTIARTPISVVLPYNPALCDVDLSGATTFDSPYPLTANEVEIDISGASSFNGSVTARELNIDLSGASTINLAGEAEDTELDISGSSDLKGKNFVTSRADVDISGASNATFTCTTSLKGDLSGSSTLNYYGNPTVDVSVTGSSSLNHRQ